MLFTVVHLFTDFVSVSIPFSVNNQLYLSGHKCIYMMYSLADVLYVIFLYLVNIKAPRESNNPHSRNTILFEEDTLL